jgi:two-component sensor histidine kinase
MLFRHEPASAALVRHRIAADLTTSGVSSDSVDEVALVVSELVGNAIRHARPSAAGTLQVDWDIDDTSGLIVRVADPSDATPQPRTPTADEPGGRGLAIVAAVAEEWGYRRSERGKEVWARVPIRSASMMTS